MENSLSASQYPQKRAESHTRAKVQERAGEPPRDRASLSRKAARPLGVKRGALSAVRLAMMAGGSAGWRGTRSLEQEAERRGEEEGGRKKNFKENNFYNFAAQSTRAFSPRHESPAFPAATNAAAPRKASREESRSMRRRMFRV